MYLMNVELYAAVIALFVLKQTSQMFKKCLISLCFCDVVVGTKILNKLKFGKHVKEMFLCPTRNCYMFIFPSPSSLQRYFLVAATWLHKSYVTEKLNPMTSLSMITQIYNCAFLQFMPSHYAVYINAIMLCSLMLCSYLFPIYWMQKYADFMSVLLCLRRVVHDLCIIMRLVIISCVSL